jgi:hypothetical protein
MNDIFKKSIFTMLRGIETDIMIYSVNGTGDVISFTWNSLKDSEPVSSDLFTRSFYNAWDYIISSEGNIETKYACLIVSSKDGEYKKESGDRRYIKSSFRYQSKGRKLNEIVNTEKQEMWAIQVLCMPKVKCVHRVIVQKDKKIIDVSQITGSDPIVIIT